MRIVNGAHNQILDIDRKINEKKQDIQPPIPKYQPPSPVPEKVIDQAQIDRDNRKKFIEEQRAQMKKDMAKKAQQAKKNDFFVEINNDKQRPASK